MTENATTRRNVILGVAAAGVAVPVVAACGSSGSDDGPSSNATGNGATNSPTDGGSPSSGGDAIKTSDIPVGGGKIFPDEQIVVTQPKAGDFKAFTAVCTHQGCIVNQVEDGQIKCPCHFSHYSIEDGSVESGPAPKPLAEKKVTVAGDTLTVS